jgi:YggT family protein
MEPFSPATEAAWFPPGHGDVYRALEKSGVLDALDKVYGPMVRPIRRILPDFGGIDLSPLVLWLLLRGLQMLVPALVLDSTRLLQ